MIASLRSHFALKHFIILCGSERDLRATLMPVPSEFGVLNRACSLPSRHQDVVWNQLDPFVCAGSQLSVRMLAMKDKELSLDL